MPEIVAVILDTETTGLKPTDEICSLSWIGLTGMPEMKILSNFNGYFDISLKTMPFAVQKIHGISKKDLAGKPRFQNLAQADFPTSTKYVICHNAAFDWTKMLKNPIPGVKVICTLKLAKALLPFEEGCSVTPTGKRSYKLVDICSDLFPDKRDFIFSGAHGAEFDCKLVLLLLRYFVGNWEIHSWEDLYNLQ